jgi:hypothetical protein
MLSLIVCKEIFMKGIAKAILVGGLIAVAQGALADGPSVSFQSTYADRHSSDPVRNTGTAFPTEARDMGPNVTFQSTYADRHANDPVRSAGSAFPTPLDTSSD